MDFYDVLDQVLDLLHVHFLGRGLALLHLHQLRSLFIGHADLLVASRYVPGGKADMGAGRRILSKILNVTYGRLLRLDLRDIYTTSDLQSALSQITLN